MGWGGGRRRERPRSVKGKLADAIVYAWLARHMRRPPGRSLHMYMFATRAHRGFNKFTSSVAIASAPSSFSGDYLDTEICRELQEQLCDPQCSEVSCNKQMNRSPSSPLLSSPARSGRFQVPHTNPSSSSSLLTTCSNATTTCSDAAAAAADTTTLSYPPHSTPPSPLHSLAPSVRPQLQLRLPRPRRRRGHVRACVTRSPLSKPPLPPRSRAAPSSPAAAGGMMIGEIPLAAHMFCWSANSQPRSRGREEGCMACTLHR